MLLVGFCCVVVSAAARSGLGVLFAEEVSFGGLEQRAFIVGGGEGDAAVDHGVADFDDLAVESPFRVVCPGSEGFCLAEAGPNASGAFPDWFEVGGESHSAASASVVLGETDNGLCGESCTEESEGE